MTKCKRCKSSVKRRNELCVIHEPEKNTCDYCRQVVSFNQKVTLENCGHTVCKACLSDHIYHYQWYEGFSTEDVLKCPHCDELLSEDDWSNAMDYFVVTGILQRTVIYAYYLDNMWFSYLYPMVDFTKMYTQTERDLLENRWYNTYHSFLWNMMESNPLKVFFFSVDILDPSTFFRHNFYIFKIDYAIIKLNNEDLFKELVEYVFHPNRIMRMGGADYLECI
jgi:hypothetical protein